MNVGDKVLKTDAKGRVWTPPEDRERLLDELERSGVPAMQFAAMVGVKYQTLATWVQKRRRARKSQASEPAALKWVEAAVEQPTTRSTLVLELGGGVTIRVNDADQATLAGVVLRAYNRGPAAC